MLDRILLEAAAGSALRLSMALAILGGLAGLGLLAAPPPTGPPHARGRLLLALAGGFAIYQALIRSFAFIGLATAPAALALLGVGLMLLLREVRAGTLGGTTLATGTTSLLVIGLAPLAMALSPAVSEDALVYHLRVPERTLVTGSWEVDPANVTTFFPLASSTLFLPTLAVDGSGSLAQLLHLSFFLLSLIALAELAEDLSPGSGRPAALIYAAAPAGLIEAGWAWTDHALVFSLLAAALSARWRAPRSGFLALGLAASLKYSGLAFAVPLAIALSVRCRRERLGTLLKAALGTAVCAPWYAANAIATGNPTYPLLPGLFGGDPAPARYLASWSAMEGERGWLAYFVHPQSVDGDLGGLAMALLAASALIWGLRRPEIRAATLVVASGLAALVPFQPSARLLLPLLAGVAPIAARMLLEAPGRLRILRWLPALLVARGLLIALGHDALFFGPVPCAVGLESRDAYLARNFPPLPLFRRARSLPESARVLAVGERRLFRFPRAASAGSSADPPTMASHLRAGSPEAVLVSLRDSGFTHVLATHEALRGRGESVQGFSAAQAVLQAEALTRCRPLDREGALYLLAVPDPRSRRAPAAMTEEPGAPTPGP